MTMMTGVGIVAVTAARAGIENTSPIVDTGIEATVPSAVRRSTCIVNMKAVLDRSRIVGVNVTSQRTERLARPRRSELRRKKRLAELRN